MVRDAVPVSRRTPQDSFGLAAAGIVARAGIVANPPRPFFTARHPDVLYCHY